MKTYRHLIATAGACLLLTACQTEVYTGLTQRDANEMLAVLAAAGIPAERQSAEAGKFRLTVKSEQLARATEVLRRTGYPRETFKSLADVFPGDGLVVSPYEQRARMMHALNQEIARTLSTIQLVQAARVHVVVPELDLRGSPVTPSSASVVVHHFPGPGTDVLTSKVRTIVSSAVQGLAPRNVSVTLFPILEDHPARDGARGALASAVLRSAVDATGPFATASVAPPSQAGGAKALTWAACIVLAGAGLALLLRGRAR